MEEGLRVVVVVVVDVKDDDCVDDVEGLALDRVVLVPTLDFFWESVELCLTEDCVTAPGSRLFSPGIRLSPLVDVEVVVEELELR